MWVDTLVLRVVVMIGIDYDASNELYCGNL